MVFRYRSMVASFLFGTLASVGCMPMAGSNGNGGNGNQPDPTPTPAGNATPVPTATPLPDPTPTSEPVAAAEGRWGGLIDGDPIAVAIGNDGVPTRINLGGLAFEIGTGTQQVPFYPGGIFTVFGEIHEVRRASASEETFTLEFVRRSNPTDYVYRFIGSLRGTVLEVRVLWINNNPMMPVYDDTVNLSREGPAGPPSVSPPSPKAGRWVGTAGDLGIIAAGFADDGAITVFNADGQAFEFGGGIGQFEFVDGDTITFFTNTMLMISMTSQSDTSVAFRLGSTNNSDYFEFSATVDGNQLNAQLINVQNGNLVANEMFVMIRE